MDFYAVLAQVLELLQRQGHVSYRALKVQFSLDDDQLEALKDELIEAQRLAADERGRVLVWVGATAAQPDQLVQSVPLATTPPSPEAERRQLTVLFCDLVDSTSLAQQLDPEDYRAVVHAYQEAAVAAMQPFDGYVAQYLGVAANVLWCLGSPAQAVRQSQEALALAQELAHPYSLALAQFWAAYLHYYRRELSVVQAQAETLLALATAHGFPLMAGLGTCLHGWALAVQGQGTVGLEQLRQGMAAVLATGQTLSQPFCLVLLAEAVGHAGHLEEGLRLLAEARTVLEANGQGELLAEAYRFQGEFLLRQTAPNTPQVEACFQQALAIARRQQAKSWELRAAMSLGRLWQQQDKRAAAYDLLAPIYGWFTEGFDTADLQEARALLAELA